MKGIKSPEKPKKEPEKEIKQQEEDDKDDDDDDDDEEDLEELMKQEKPKRKCATPSVYSKVVKTGEYVTKGDVKAHKTRVEILLEDTMANTPKETEEEAAQWEMESDLVRRT